MKRIKAKPMVSSDRTSYELRMRAFAHMEGFSSNLEISFVNNNSI